ncbi:hypothetical protein BJ912DRAFT_1141875 [Pholiota molesta]|nr:hypothetical protein BJ912DRAFT_1141875 [Pholiota molesta]
MHTRNIGPSSFLTQTDTNILLSPSERTGRKSYKLSNRKGGEKKEAVWPPQLEAALLEGLRKYRPISKSGRPLRRFTKRNVSISRHIFATTGKTRTAKQVGSRLQQITESTKDEEIIRLITSREVVLDPQDSQDAQSSYSQTDSSKSDGYDSTPTTLNTPSSSVTPSEAGSPQNSIPGDQVTLFAQLLSTDINSASYLGLDADIPKTGINLFLSVDSAEGLRVDGNTLSNARRLPTFLLHTSSTTFLRFPSHLLDLACTLPYLHVTLASVKPESPGGAYIYVAPLLPSYWESLVHKPSIERYTVYLDILELDRGIPMDTGRRKFSVAINMKDIRIQAAYPDLPLAHHLPTTSYLPDLSMHLSSHLQNGPAMAAWNDNIISFRAQPQRMDSTRS